MLAPQKYLDFRSGGCYALVLLTTVMAFIKWSVTTAGNRFEEIIILKVCASITPFAR
jgi:hypothetical protein